MTRTKPCRASIQTDAGRDFCQGRAGHKKHWYVTADGNKWIKVSWWPRRKSGDK